MLKDAVKHSQRLSCRGATIEEHHDGAARRERSRCLGIIDHIIIV
jgi:hypothetical protein